MITFLQNKTGYWVIASLLLMQILGACKSSKKASSTGATGLQQSAYMKGQIGKSDSILIESTFIDATKADLLEDYPLAIELYKKVLKLDPANDAANYQLATIFIGMGDYPLAKEYSTAALKTQPNNKWYLILHAEILADMNENVEAIKIIDRLIAIHPNDEELYIKKAFLLQKENKIDDAIEVYDKVEQMIGIDEDLIIQKQKLYLQINKLEKAVAEIQKLIKYDAKEQRYYQLLAETYQANNMPEKANAVYDQLLKLDPKSPYALISLAENAKKKGDRNLYLNYMKEVFSNKDLNIDTKIRVLLPYLNAFQKNDTIQENEALALCKVLATTHSEQAKAFAIYADFLYQNDNDTAAITQYNKALALDKSVYDVWQQTFFIYSDLKRYNDLIKVTEEAIELFPNKPLSFYFNGLAYSQLKQYEKAIEAFNMGKETVVKNDALKVQFYSSLGDAYHSIKRYAASDSAFDAALLLDEDNAYVLNNYSYYLSIRKEGNLEKAKKMSAQSLVLEPDNDSFLDTYGWILYQLGNYEEAKKFIEKAIEKGSANSAVVVEHLGDVLYRLGNFDEALKQWQKAKELGGDSEFLDKKIADRKMYE